MEQLVDTLKELQKERIHLEKVLSEKQKQRQQLSWDLDQARENLTHNQHKHVQISDSLLVTKQKMSHVQTISLSLQDEVSNSVDKLNSLQQTIESHKESQRLAQEEFETDLSKITQELFQAKVSHKKSSLMNAINETIKDIDSYKQLEMTESKETETLTQHLANLNIQKSNVKCTPDSITKVLQICLRLKEKDKEDAEKILSSFSTNK